MKTYVLDTNVLLHDPNALNSFQENHVVIPLPVLEEIDHFKQDNASEKGYHAREVVRQIEALRVKGSLTQGVPMDNGGTLRIAYTNKNVPVEISADTKLADNRIMAVALDVQAGFTEGPTILVSKDCAFRIRAEVAGITVQDYSTDKVPDSHLGYTGWREVVVSGEYIDALNEAKALDCNFDGLNPHECMLLVDESNPKHTSMAKADKTGKVLKLIQSKGKIWKSISPRNLEQHFALALLTDPECQILTITGHAGTGKTLVSIAAGLDLQAQRLYNQVLISRPTVPLGRDIGFLPGTVEEKMSPWMQPLHDSLDFLCGTKQVKEGLFDMDIVQIEPLTYIRGRSMPNKFFILDESQALTILEVKTIATRASSGTKLIFCGDQGQIDNLYVDKHSNGLAHLMSKLKGDSLYGHIFLSRGERSALAQTAAEKL